MPILSDEQFGKHAAQVAQFDERNDLALALMHYEGSLTDSLLWIVEKKGVEIQTVGPGITSDDFPVNSRIIVLSFSNPNQVMTMIRKLSEAYLSMTGVTPGESIRSQIYNAFDKGPYFEEMTEVTIDVMRAMRQNIELGELKREQIERQEKENLSHIEPINGRDVGWQDSDCIKNPADYYKPRDDTGPAGRDVNSCPECYGACGLNCIKR